MTNGERDEADPSESDAPSSGEQPAGEAAGGDPEQAAAPEPTPLEKAEQRVRELEQKVASSEQEAKASHNKMLRVAADFDNYRKRAAREADEARARGQHNALMKLLPVFDNLERATANVNEATDAKSMADGLRMVVKHFVETLGKLGIERVESVGKPFDPMLHESIQYDHHDAIAAGLVAQELQPGYKLGDALLRPALVVVSKGPKPADDPKPTDEATDEPQPEAQAANGEETKTEPEA